MNGIKVNLNQSIVLILMILNCSCSTIKPSMVEYDFYNKNYYYNDSLKIGVDFPQAINFVNLNQVGKRQLKKELKGITHPDLNQLLVYGVSSDNSYSTFLFYEITKDSLVYKRIVKTDSVHQYAQFEKQKGNTKLIFIVNRNPKSIALGDSIVKKISIDSIDKVNLSYVKILNNYRKGNGLVLIDKLKKNPLQKVKGYENSAKGFIMTAQSFISSNNIEYDSLIEDYEKKRKIFYKPIIEKLGKERKTIINEEVFNKIKKLTNNNQLFILNEDHYYPKHRIFAAQLLNVLKDNGFKYISLEDFAAVEDSKYFPSYKSGFYVTDPYFAYFIRKAKKMGFIILGHENLDKGIERELGQAKNIMKILEEDSIAKIFMYVGHAHLEKTQKEGRRKMMATYLKELSGIEPFTINQTLLFTDTKSELTLISKEDLNEEERRKTTSDYYLINNIKTDLKTIYPDEIFKDVIIKDKKFQKYNNVDLLISVYDLEEYKAIQGFTIPILKRLDRCDHGVLKLKLPIGGYHINITTATGVDLFNGEIVVKP
ncbi:hypothetical protein [Flavobacterium sp. '19STA2R22 D10 B1']|uniref:hypothetical protein n=1 Tax=Flavobacterium aerium TaxID=3037261 RepID=UPI00278C13AF|nr:hypothetical protein [Flavobacterium sp. '19STA2R22 D10 B1']